MEESMAHEEHTENNDTTPQSTFNLTKLVGMRDLLGPRTRIGKRTVLIERPVKRRSPFIQNLALKQKLRKHRGCVNTIQWNDDGSRIITGSDDCMVNIWKGYGDYALQGTINTGHHRNIFSARFIPGTNDTKGVSCGMDGEVRMFDFTDSTPSAARTTELFSNRLMAYKIWFLPEDSNSFLTTHQDGVVRQFDLRQKNSRPFLQMLSARNKKVSVNCIAFCPLNPNLLVVGGGDIYAHLYDIRATSSVESPRTIVIDDAIQRYCPGTLEEKSESSRAVNDYYISGIDFNDQKEILINYTREDVYLFDGNTFTSDGISNVPKQRFVGRRNVQTFLKEVAFMGDSQYVVTGSDCGNVFIWNKDDAKICQVLKGDKRIVNGVSPHPHLPGVLATCGIDSEGKIFESTDENTFQSEKAHKVITENEEVDDDDYDEEPMDLIQLFQILAQLRRRQGANVPEGRTIPEDVINMLFGGQSEPDSSEPENHDESSEPSSQDEIQDEFQDEFQDENPDSEFPDQEESEARLEESNRLRSEANREFRENNYDTSLELYNTAIDILEISSLKLKPETQLEIEKTRTACLLNRAAVYLQQKKWDLALQDCNVVLVQDEFNLKGLYRRASAYYGSGKLEEALVDLEKAGNLNPEDSSVQKLLQTVRTKLEEKK